MQADKRFVKIELETEIKDDSGRQVTKIKADGQMFNTLTKTVLRFTEEIDDQPKVQTMITIKAEQVTINRSGGVEMKQQFKPAQYTENIYRHQFGIIYMETYTKSLTYQPEMGQLLIDYSTKLSGENERQHKLLLTIKEDES
ncbi:DUF1934 domain-containing protein [Amphibacillus sediminis]|uniref:DUF1934 domain-containing protein n=1 Tax=Amphibacillus sediminis TaxID=360185 RepID=UPI0008303429|nr:DUF1934 domain-containing protein [Amphibacillus sediminis]